MTPIGVSSAAVVVRGVDKSFGRRRVLSGLDLDVPAGTMTAVLGPSGCGKTTLLRILAGFEDPDTGSVSIGGRPMAGVPTHLRRVGLMPQEGALFPHLDVAGNVAFGVVNARRAAARSIVGHWLNVVGLDGLAGARPHELSGGQQQRVALARALAAEPRVLLLDEPFAALDAGLRGQVREDIAAILRSAGTTAVLVTHDQAEALSLADSVALLLSGSIAQHSTPADLYHQPTSLAAARFVGATTELAGQSRARIVRTALGEHTVRIPVPDGPVVTVLRPQQLRLGVVGDPGATVTARRFYGPDTALHVVLDDGSALTLRDPDGAAVAAGDRVTIRVDGPVLAYPLPQSPAGG